jgi:aspartate/methionine/tyrosine aminotransferase
VRPRGSSVGFPELLTGTPVDAFCERLVREHGVLLVPGSMFEAGTSHFRIGLGRASLPAGLAALGDFMDGLDAGRG